MNILVTDNGIGFEDKYKEKIFGIFQRLHGRNYEGTGIGLAIARKIIENHGGFIFANGKVNKGAKFHIILPLRAAHAYSNFLLKPETIKPTFDFIWCDLLSAGFRIVPAKLETSN